MPNAHDAARCAFCGSEAALTSEHVWGDWIKAYVSPQQNKHIISYQDVEYPGDWSSPARRIRAGDPLNAQVKLVCADCNNGWMSKVQNNVKIHLIPLLKGERCIINSAGLEKIATWITMATMTAEFLTHRRRQIAITQGQRMVFMNTSMPLDTWRIWMGFSEKTNPSQEWAHTSLPIYDPEDIPNVEHFDGAPQTNTQCTTVRIGRFVFHSMSSVERANIAMWNWQTASRVRSVLVPIWPKRDPFVIWPVHGMSDADFRSVATSFVVHADAVAKAHGF
jgi:hypothetical protein